MAPNDLAEERLYRFLEEHGNNRVKRELMLFWGMHPNTRFDKKIIRYALDDSKLDVEDALRAMVEEGLLDSHICNGMTLYSLTTNEDSRRPLLALTALGWDRWQPILRRMGQRDKQTNLRNRLRTTGDTEEA